jgi:glycosyltransferase involved in cell wall biosynthesis
MLAFWLLLGRCDIYIKCINGRFALPVTFAIARLTRKPFILWTGIWFDVSTPAHRLFGFVTRFILRHVDAIVVYGDHVRKYLVEKGVDEDRIFIAAHAVQNDIFDKPVAQGDRLTVLNNLGIPPTRKIVLYLGRLVPEKGLDYLIDAFALLNFDDAVLILAGAGSQKTALEAAVSERNLRDKVFFPGYVTQQEAIIYYSLAYVFVIPSITTPVFKEPWGLVVNEALNQGVPVIASEAVGAAMGGLVQDGKNGFVVRERDSRQLADALHRVLDDPDLRTRLSQSARSIISDWNNEQMVAGFTEAIKYVAK